MFLRGTVHVIMDILTLDQYAQLVTINVLSAKLLQLTAQLALIIQDLLLQAALVYQESITVEPIKLVKVIKLKV